MIASLAGLPDEWSGEAGEAPEWVTFAFALACEIVGIRNEPTTRTLASLYAAASAGSIADTSGFSQKAQIPAPPTSNTAAMMNGACHDP